MRYIGFYSTSGSVQEAIDEQELGKPYVVYLRDEHRLDWNSKSKTIIYSAMPLTIEALEDGRFETSDRKVELTYSINNGEWVTQVGPKLNLFAGDKVRFKGNLDNSNNTRNLFKENNLRFIVYGNILSLYYGDDFADKTSGMKEQYMFSNCNYLMDASNLILPENLINYNYAGMFAGCSSLTTAPELPATTLTSGCYQSMFEGCTNLNYIKCLATSLGDNWSLRKWVQGVSTTGTFVKHPDAVWPSGANGIPNGWTIINAEI